MIIEEKIREWQQDIANKHCKECSNSCCSQEHRIFINNYSLPLFREKGVPIVNIRELNKFFLRRWGGNINYKLFLKSGSEITKPSLVQISKESEDSENKWLLYANPCPFYSKQGGCEVHEDTRRPSVCKDYPIVFLGCNDRRGNFLDVRIMKTCEYFNKEEVKSSLTRNFPVRIVN